MTKHLRKKAVWAEELKGISPSLWRLGEPIMFCHVFAVWKAGCGLRRQNINSNLVSMLILTKNHKVSNNNWAGTRNPNTRIFLRNIEQSNTQPYRKRGNVAPNRGRQR